MIKVCLVTKRISYARRGYHYQKIFHAKMLFSTLDFGSNGNDRKIPKLEICLVYAYFLNI